MVCLLSTLVLSSAAQKAEPVIWKMLPAALDEAAETAKPLLVYVDAPWCGPCRKLERKTLSDRQVARRLKGFALSRLGFDERDRVHQVGPYRLNEADWAYWLGAQTTPALIFMRPDGAILGSHEGYLTPASLIEILEAVYAERSPR